MGNVEIKEQLMSSHGKKRSLGYSRSQQSNDSWPGAEVAAFEHTEAQPESGIEEDEEPATEIRAAARFVSAKAEASSKAKSGSFVRPEVREVAARLKEVGNASEQLADGQVGKRAKIGAEDRDVVTDVDQFPFRAICSLQMYRNGLGPAVGTGFLFGRNIVVTAGHNLCHNRDLRATDRAPWTDEVRVFAGRFGRRNYRFEAVCSRRDQMLVSQGWRHDKDKELDWGVLILDDPFDEEDALLVEAWDDSDLLGNEFNVVGYPATTTRDAPSSEPYLMWADVGTIDHAEDFTLIYTMDTSGGQSGCPVIAWTGGKDVVVGIHNYGEQGRHNQATRMTRDIVAALNELNS